MSNPRSKMFKPKPTVDTVDILNLGPTSVYLSRAFSGRDYGYDRDSDPGQDFNVIKSGKTEVRVHVDPRFAVGTESRSQIRDEIYRIRDSKSGGVILTYVKGDVEGLRRVMADYQELKNELTYIDGWDAVKQVAVLEYDCGSTSHPELSSIMETQAGKDKIPFVQVKQNDTVALEELYTELSKPNKSASKQLDTDAVNKLIEEAQQTVQRSPSVR